MGRDKTIFVLRLFLIGFLLSFSSGSRAITADISRNENTNYAFIGVHVISMLSERVLKNQIVIVKQGKITQIINNDDISLPENIIRINAHGKYLLPGLSDMHTHIRGEEDLLLYLATGVTTLRNLSGSEDILTLISKIDKGEVLGPELYSTSPILEGENFTWPFSVKITDPSEADSLIKGYKENGYQAIKIYHTISKPVHEAIVKAGLKYNIPIVGHVSFEGKIEGALNSHQNSIEHLRGYDIDGLSMETLAKDGGRSAERFGSWLNMTDERMRELVLKTKEAGTWNIPTFIVVELLYDLQKRKRIVNMGVGVMTGTDTMVPYLIPGFTPIDEIEHFVDAGLSPYDAIKASTSGPAEFLGKQGSFGTISVGKSANFILVDGNPLENVKNLWNLEGISIRGKWLDKERLTTLIEKQAKNYE